MRILVTGAKGFIGKNLVLALKNNGYDDILEFDADSEPGLLRNYCGECSFVFHLAGVNRPRSEEEFETVNAGFTAQLLQYLSDNPGRPPVMLSSSAQASPDSPYADSLYALSKRKAEDMVFEYAQRVQTRALVYRFPNVFGKWCRPGYNSAVATFCHNIARGLPITVNDPERVMNLVYIDDLTCGMIAALTGKESKDGDYCTVSAVYTEKLGVIADTIKCFAECPDDLSVPDMSDELVKKLYSTYLSYLPADKIKYPLCMKQDERGSFTEFIRTCAAGQVSVNVSHPGIVKGNHWHNSKHEKFLIVSGRGVVRFRSLDSNEVFQAEASGENLEVISIPPGYMHSITNTGDADMVMLVWANEPFDPESPDTYYMQV